MATLYFDGAAHTLSGWHLLTLELVWQQDGATVREGFEIATGPDGTVYLSHLLNRHDTLDLQLWLLDGFYTVRDVLLAANESGDLPDKYDTSVYLGDVWVSCRWQEGLLRAS